MYLLIIPTIIIPLLLLFLIKPLLSHPNPNKTKHLKLPPSPPSLPFIGHLHLFKKPFHHTLSSLSSLYGPLLLLNFSSRRLLIISSYSLALQCFTTLDLNFATRPRLPSGRFLTYNYTTICWYKSSEESTETLLKKKEMKALKKKEMKALIVRYNGWIEVAMRWHKSTSDFHVFVKGFAN